MSSKFLLLKRLIEQKSFNTQKQLLLLNTTRHLLSSKKDVQMILPINVRSGKWKMIYNPTSILLYHEKSNQNCIKYLVRYYEYDILAEFPYQSSGLFNFGTIQKEEPQLHQIPLRSGQYTVSLNREQNMLFVTKDFKNELQQYSDIRLE
jgi:hypothetical protein